MKNCIVKNNSATLNIIWTKTIYKVFYKNIYICTDTFHLRMCINVKFPH